MSKESFVRRCTPRLGGLLRFCCGDIRGGAREQTRGK